MKVSEDVERLLKKRRPDSQGRYKALTHEQLLNKYTYYGIRSFGPLPLDHQRAATVACVENESFLNLLDKGLGKSKVILDTFTYHRGNAGGLKTIRGLILCPNQTHVMGWSKEIALHAPWAKVELCPEAPDQKKLWYEEVLKKEHDLAVIDYSSLQTVLCDRKGKGGLELNDDKAEALGSRYFFSALDEIHNTKDRGTLRFEILLRVLNSSLWCYGATATLFNQDPTEAWAQCFLLDAGETFGTTITAFKTIFCKWKYDPFARGNRVEVFDEGQMERFRAWLKGISIRFQTRECLDLPSLRFVRPELRVTDEQRRFYSLTLKELREVKKSDPDARVNVFQKLRRVMSGFIPIAVEGSKDKLKHEYIPMASSPKLQWLVEKLGVWKEPVVVFYEFTRTGEQITQALTSWRVGWLYGECKNKREILKAWNNEELDVLVIQNNVGAAGLNLQRSRRQVFYECPQSAIVRSQAEARCWRLGQERVTYIYDLFFPDTVEQRVFDHTQEGMSLHAAVVEGTKEEKFM